MSQTIIFKKEFEDKLKDLSIKTRFVKNIKRNSTDKEFTKSIIRMLNNQASWFMFINSAFPWSETPERFKYWCDISCK